MAASILDVLAPDERAAVRKAAGTRRFKKGEYVFHEGDPAKSLHVIESGAVAIKGITPLGEETTFTVLGPGSSFGELALVHPGQERTASAVAAKPSRTIEVHRDVFTELRHTHPNVEQLLVAALAETVARLSHQLVDAHYVPVERRLARRILEVADALGGRETGTELNFTQEDLASLVGATRQTVNRILKDMEHDGVIVVERGRVTLSDIERLTRRAR